jgi:hypothetical protein
VAVERRGVLDVGQQDVGLRARVVEDDGTAFRIGLQVIDAAQHVVRVDVVLVRVTGPGHIEPEAGHVQVFVFVGQELEHFAGTAEGHIDEPRGVVAAVQLVVALQVFQRLLLGRQRFLVPAFFFAHGVDEVRQVGVEIVAVGNGEAEQRCRKDIGDVSFGKHGARAGAVIGIAAG